jgi:hypothetical protein
VSHYRLLVLDIDGTLTASNGRISPQVREAVRAAVSSGCLVTLATGRSFLLARAYAVELDLRLPLIVHSGAAVRDSASGQVLYESPVPIDAARRMATVASAYGLQPVLFQGGRLSDLVVTGLEAQDTDASRWYLGNKTEQLIRRPPHALVDGVPPLNIAVPASSDQALALLPQVIDIPGCRTFITRFPQHSWTLVEGLAANCSKAAAMAYLARQLGVGMENVIAVGDQPNDLEMIEAAGLGVAMGNAAPEVRACADTVAPSHDEDGVAWVIEQFILR